jgi:hypothetical protein
MPPKCSVPSKKVEEKKKQKVIEDKTFGLKNKKGAKQQKFVQMVAHQVKNPNQSLAKLESEKHAAKKKTKEEELDDLNKLLKPVTAMPKVDKNVDPKSILCVFFKQGMCTKGDKCKWSHDLEIERKAEKRNIFCDVRENEDNIDEWDEDKLLDVVDKKHAEGDKLKPRTAIICKHFLQALDDSKYGWFWECPNGDKCIYRHAVPPGYVLKKDRVKLEQQNKEEEITLEDLIEKERAALGANLTKITFDSFCQWKDRKRKERQRKIAAEEKRKRIEMRAGKEGGLSGRELFTFNPDLITQDDEEADDTRYSVHSDEDKDEMEAKEVNEAMFSNGYAYSSNASGGILIDEDLFDENDLPEDEDDDGSGNENVEGNGSGNEDDVDTLKENVQRLDVNQDST